MHDLHNWHSRCKQLTAGATNRSNLGSGEFGAGGVGVIALVGEQRFDTVVEHSEQRAKALHILRLARRQDEAERSSVSIAAGMELGGEAAARPAKPLGLLIPFARESRLIMKADKPKPTTVKSVTDAQTMQGARLIRDRRADTYRAANGQIEPAIDG